MTTLAEQLERLAEALEPFAKCCDDWIADDEDGEEWAKFRLLIKDYRRARDAHREIIAALKAGEADKQKAGE